MNEKFSVPKHSILLLTILIISSRINAQVDLIKSNLDKWRTDYPQEKVYLQTDKSYYVGGEDIWIKTWCTTIDGPTYLSRIIYIDIVDQKGNVVQKKLYRLDSLGSSAANFIIPGNIESGNYSVNAYTLWMLNFPEFIFRKNIFIYGNDYNPNASVANNIRAKLQLTFFPEGGDLISGIENRVAFKATDTYGYPINVSGQIETDDGAKIIEFSAEHDGMGFFEFQPVFGKKYKAVITSAGKNKLNFQLPDVKEEGVNLKINNTNPSRLFFVVNRGEKNKESFNELRVVTQLNYQVINTTLLNIDEGQSAASISKKGLPPGILQITVFNKNNLPIAERIAFNENYSFAQPIIKNELKNLNTKGKNRISFNFDSTANPSISCLVTGYDSNLIYEDNIASSLLFAGELKGPIYNEGYYVKDKNPATLRHLDLLLMTQGWRRFNWKKVNSLEPIALKYPVESSLSFRGTMRKSDRNDIVKDGRISFLIRGADSTSILAEATVTDKGEFLLADINYKKDAEVAYMGTNNKKENLIVDVKLFPNYIDSLRKSVFTSTLSLDTIEFGSSRSQLFLSLQAGILNNDTAAKYKQLENVTLKARKVSKIDSLNNEYATGIFQTGKSIDPQELKNVFSIWQMLQQSVPGITIEGNPFDPTVSFNRFSGLAIANPISGEESSDPLSTPDVLEEGGIAYFINEVNVSKDVINSLSVNDIALIKVLKNEAAALGVTQGAIAFYTKTGKDFSARIYDKTYTRERREGYSIVKEFYSPDYSVQAKKLENDSRYTLYWSGDIAPAKDGKYRFEFYNNDVSKKLRLLIQGISPDGELIYHQYIIE